MGLAIFLLVVCGLVGILYKQRHFRDSGPPGW
jgi:hypothetical protein